MDAWNPISRTLVRPFFQRDGKYYILDVIAFGEMVDGYRPYETIAIWKVKMK
jgi:hypothetical protein